MRSGWPHTQDDHGAQPAGQRQATLRPEISWPTGYSGLEYQDGDYRYPAQAAPAPYAAQPPAAIAAPGGEHPYAAFGSVGYGAESGSYPAASIDDFGYGDPGYSNPGYQGPAAQDAGIAGTRTVRGFVEAGRGDAGYRYGGQQAGYGSPESAGALSAPAAPQAGYGGRGQLERAYPAPDNQAANADMYRQPWDYDQPLRYDGEEPSYPGVENSGFDGYGAGPYSAPVYDATDYGTTDYNGSDYSMPGVNGPGYDLSGIIHTGEFPEIGFDQPSYNRLSYDDPRYDTPHDRRTRFDLPALDAPPRDQTRFDLPVLDDFDETRLDHVWPAEEDLAGVGLGYGDDGFGGVGGDRSGYLGQDLGGPDGFFGGMDDTRLSQTRFDMPALDGFNSGARFDETRIDGMRALAPATEFRAAATGLLAPPEEQPLSWADETSLDTFGDMDQTPAAFTRTLEREAPGEAVDDTAARRAIGKRRGRSGDKRQWMALGAIAVVAAGAIGFVLMKFNGPSGPTHTVSAPTKVASFTQEPNLEQQMKVGQLAQETVKTTSGQASNVVSAVYQQGSSAPGSDPQIFMFVGGKLANSDPSASITSFEQNYRGAAAVSPGSMSGNSACGEATSNGESVAVCVWFDNDTFGELVSPTMNTAHLASTLNTVRPGLEHVAQ
jgi:hypothetical protein